jgi:hypothetical protein
VEEALTITKELREPETITVSFATKYPEIKRFCWGDDRISTL